MPTARQLAKEIAAKSPLTLRRVKHAFDVVEEMPMREGYRFEQGVSAEMSLTEETRQAQRAFVERQNAKNG